MNGRTILSSLRQMCRDIDAGRPLRRINLGRAVAPVIIGFSLAASGCPGDLGCHPEYGAPPFPPPVTEICDDGIDNDRDGRTDCADDDCSGNGACEAVSVYGAPPIEEDCADGLDNDGDGRADCADDDCDEDETCEAVDVYGAPFPGASPAPSDGGPRKAP